MLERKEIIAGRILADMKDGVMTVDLTGEIITFNQAAERILGITAMEAMSRKFGEVFFELEGNDDFNQAILDAIYDSSASHNRLVHFTNNGNTAILSLTTTFLRTEEAGEAARIGVIAVFSDITEVRALQEAEARMALELKTKHGELQKAFLVAEATNKNLQAALKKVKIIRIAATIFAIVIFLVIGLFIWGRKPLAGGGSSAERSDDTVSAAGTTHAVARQAVSSSLSLTGKLQPLQTVNVTSPLSGKVERVNFHYGDLVTAGQVLVAMDVSEAQVKHREAKAAFIKATENFRQVDEWGSGADMARAKRSLTKAKLSLENQKKTLDETERLFEKGIIPASEYESTRQQHIGQQLDYQSAEEEVKAAAAKGNPENVKIARFEMENARVRLNQIESELANAVVVSPVSGIAMKPAGSTGKEGKTIERGGSFQQGEVLLAVGDLTGFSVTCKVDEIDVTKVRQGQKVRIGGDAFPDLNLPGVIRSISPQAEEGESRGTPSFAITVAIETVTPEQGKRLMVGMSANLEIVIHEKPDALMAPVAAIRSEGGKRYVMRKQGPDPNAPAEKVLVETGYTTLDSVEITKGLTAGDVVEVGEMVQPLSDTDARRKEK